MLALRSCQTQGVSIRRQRLSTAHLYLVCDALEPSALEAALDGGVDLVQLRMKDRPDTEIVSVARRFAALCAEHGVLFIVNDRPDLAMAVGADGVHIGQDDGSVADARAVVGPDALLGLSTHTPAQIDATEGVDYIGVGPVHATPTKPGRSAVGLELVRYAAEHARVPWFAIGGISADNADAVRAAGATRVAVVRAIGGAADPREAARRLRRVMAGREDESVAGSERVGSAQP
jgi:thiamine-phosphate pyrophosphorylase